MTRQQAIYTALQDLYDSDLNSVAWSIYENTSRLGDDDLWRNLDLSEIMYDINDCYVFEQFLQAAADGDFNPRDDYWRWTCYGPESSDTLDYDLVDFAEIIDDHADDNWVHNELPREITDVLDEYASEPEDDDTDWPEDATDYDGVDDPDEDEPSPAKPAILTEAQLHEQLRAFYPSLMTGKDDTQIAQLINALQIWCQMLHGHYITGTGELAEAINRYLPYHPHEPTA